MKAAVADYAASLGDTAAGEAEAVVVRDALAEYFASRKINVGAEESPIRLVQLRVAEDTGKFKTKRRGKS